MTKANKALNMESKRIVVEDLETKKKILSISEKTGETVKEIVLRLVEKEFKEL